MPSIHPDFEYDIFISYRQNDNRSDKWVSNLVEALKEELEATLKNPISIYFDENPHDGLLETHQVDASLAKKLKCLVFMPIISQTYCDETSFAWEHEFMPFIKMAKEDELGMNITLSNGNVVSRVLPVKIHRLDSDDQNTLEAILDGPLRSIDFIYQEAGVNRPLKPDDDRTLNLEKTDYHNQINKVANALKDIGLSLLKESGGKITLPIPERERAVEVAKSSNKGIYIGLAIIIIALLAFWGYKQFYNSPGAETEDFTIAVLAFDDQSPDGDQEWLGDGMADEILNVLTKVKGLQVIGKTSSFSFKGKGLTTKEIGETLNVSTVLEGSVSKIGDKLRITAQLIDVKTDAHIWSKKYDRDAADIFMIVDEVAQSIASSLRSELSIEELNNIKIGYQVNPQAYEYYLKGFHFHWEKYIHNHVDADFIQSEKMFIRAIEIDSTYLDAYAGLADLYDTKSQDFGQFSSKRDSVIDLGFRIDPNSPYLLAIKGFSLCSAQYLDSCFYYFNKAYQLNPNHVVIKTLLMNAYPSIGLFSESMNISIDLLKNDPINVMAKKNLASSLFILEKYNDAIFEVNELLKLEPNDRRVIKFEFFIEGILRKNVTNGRLILDKLEKINPGKNDFEKSILLALEGKNEEALNLNKSLELYSILGMKKEAISLVDSMCAVTKYTRGYFYLRLKNKKLTGFISDEPAFKEILAEAKKVHEERMAKYGHIFDEE